MWAFAVRGVVLHAFCPVHDRIKCRCGYRLVDGIEWRCPHCVRSVLLSDR
jgi:hypothetical protein